MTRSEGPAAQQAPDPKALDQARRLLRGTVDALPEGALASRLSEGRPLRVKLGIDPTAPDIHLGHTVVLQKLRDFQEEGHRVVLIIGDFTARVGDPSGRSTARPLLTGEEIDRNARTFQEQAFRILDEGATEVRFNSEWLDMPMERLFDVLKRVTVARLLEREDFARRIERDQPISALELLYPVLQGYDSVVVEADVELGGTDQLFNLLFARGIQQSFGHLPQSVVTVPILSGTGGPERMSKSVGNYVGVTEEPAEMFGKVMSISDDRMDEWYGLLLGRERDPATHPADAKRALARALVERFHGPEEADRAQEAFDAVFVDGEIPDDVKEVALAAGPAHLPAVIADAFGVSRSEARRLISQGGVRIDGDRPDPAGLDVDAAALDGALVQVGRRRFARLVVR